MYLDKLKTKERKLGLGTKNTYLLKRRKLNKFNAGNKYDYE